MPPDTPVAALPFGDVLEACRQFLLRIANAELPAELRAKGGASDLVQEAMAEAHRNRAQFRGRTLADLRAWLRGILLNQLAMFRRRFVEAGARDVTVEVPLPPDGVLPPASEPSPADELAEREECVRLVAAVKRLPEDFREVVRLHVAERLCFAEVGERLGRSADAARKLFARALDRLRENLRPPGPNPESP